MCAVCSMHARCGILESNAQHVCAVWSMCCAASYCYPLIVGAMLSVLLCCLILLPCNRRCYAQHLYRAASYCYPLIVGAMRILCTTLPLTAIP